MYCNYCGNKLEDEAIYCPKCGRKVVKENESTPYTPEEQDVVKEKVKDYLGGKALKCGILSLVFPFISLIAWYIGLVALGVALELESSANGIPIFFMLVGLGFAIAGLGMVNKANQYKDEYEEKFGNTTGRVSVGKGLSIGGVVVSIIMLVISAIFAFIILFI